MGTDRQFRGALQRLANLTGLIMKEDFSVEAKQKIANDGLEKTYNAKTTMVITVNGFNEEEILISGNKFEVTKWLNATIRTIELSRGKPVANPPRSG